VQRTVSEEDSKKRYRKCFKCGTNFVTQELVVIKESWFKRRTKASEVTFAVVEPAPEPEPKPKKSAKLSPEEAKKYIEQHKAVLQANRPK
jgi:hypothetical protein